jgi:hypothetical protein
MLERGEYVLNRRAVAAIGPDTLDALNFAMAPRFRTGGIVELLHPFNDPARHGGSNSHLHIAASTVKRIVAIGRKLQGMGWLVGEHPAFGGIQASHAPGGYHYTSQAIDANWPDAGAEAGKIRQVLGMLGAGKLGQSAKLKRVMMPGSGAFSGVGQAALDAVRKGAQAKLNRAGRVEGLESGVGANFSGSWTKVMASIARSRGWNLNAWRTLVQKESGGNPNARNPSSGAYGLGQFLGSTARQYAPYGALSSNPVKQIQAMAKYIGDRYGSPSSALAFHNRNNWYRKGGRVGMARGGGIGRRGSSIWRNRTARQRWNPAMPGRGKQFKDLQVALALAAQAQDWVAYTDALKGMVAIREAQAAGVAQRLAKPGLPRGQRVALAERLTRLRSDAGDFRSQLGEFLVPGGGEQDTRLAEAQEEANRLQEEANALAREQVEAARALEAEVKRNTEFASSVAAVGERTALRLVADMISGQVVGQGMVPRSHLPSGPQARY